MKSKTDDELVMLTEGGPVSVSCTLRLTSPQFNCPRSGARIASSMSCIPWCKNPRSTSTYLRCGQENHLKRLRS